MALIPPPNQVALARKFGQKYGVDPRLLLAIGGHETQWGTTGAGRPSQGGYALGYGVTDSGILSKYAGLANQYRYAASTLSGWGAKTIADVMAGKAGKYASDPNWEKGVAATYKGLGGAIPPGLIPPSPVMAPPRAPPSVVTTPRRTPGTPPRTVSERVFDPGALAQGIFSSLASGGTPDVAGLVPQSYKNVTTRIPGKPGQVKLGPPAPPHPVPGGNHPTGPNVPATKNGQGIVQLAAKQLGQPYVWGGESRSEGGFDCSGLIDWSLRQEGYKGPRVTTNTIKVMGQSVKGKPLQPGDLVLSNGGEHVSIYAGNGKCIVAPHAGAVVRWQPLSDFHITDVRRL